MSGAAKRRIDRAIILAAGRGSRLDRGDLLPKPLRPIAGVPLIGRILRTLASEGIREAVVVVGYEGDRIQAALTDEALHAGVTVHFVQNDRWERSNGLSLLAAREWLDRECLLTMADHLVAPAHELRGRPEQGMVVPLVRQRHHQHPHPLIVHHERNPADRCML